MVGPQLSLAPGELCLGFRLPAGRIEATVLRLSLPGKLDQVLEEGEVGRGAQKAGRAGTSFGTQRLVIETKRRLGEKECPFSDDLAELGNRGLGLKQVVVEGEHLLLGGLAEECDDLKMRRAPQPDEERLIEGRLAPPRGEVGEAGAQSDPLDGFADLGGDHLLRAAARDEVGDGRGLFEIVEVAPMEILDEGEDVRGGLVDLVDENVGLRQSGAAAAAHAPLAGDDAVAVADRPHERWPQDLAQDLDIGGELLVLGIALDKSPLVERSEVEKIEGDNLPPGLRKRGKERGRGGRRLFLGACHSVSPLQWIESESGQRRGLRGPDGESRDVHPSRRSRRRPAGVDLRRRCSAREARQGLFARGASILLSCCWGRGRGQGEARPSPAACVKKPAASWPDLAAGLREPRPNGKETVIGGGHSLPSPADRGRRPAEKRPFRLPHAATGGKSAARNGTAVRSLPALPLQDTLS
jgi:hypothetical protein